MATKTGIVNGSDMLLFINGKAMGHCSSHSTTIASETKDIAVKPVSTAGLTSGLWKNKEVSGLSVSISGDGFCCYAETESGYKSILAETLKGKSVAVKCMERGGSTTPYLEGNFVITSLDRTDPANDKSTYSISLENDGEVTFHTDAVTGETIDEE